MVIFVVVILLWNTFQVGKTTRHELTYSEFNEQLNKGQVAKITLRDQSITGIFKAGGQYAKDEEFKVELPFRPDAEFTDRLITAKVEVLAEPGAGQRGVGGDGRSRVSGDGRRIRAPVRRP